MPAFNPFKRTSLQTDAKQSQGLVLARWIYAYLKLELLDDLFDHGVRRHVGAAM